MGGTQTSNDVRRIPISIPRPHALFAYTMMCTSALRVLRMMLRALAVATPGVLNVTTWFVMHELRRPPHARWRGRSSALGGPRNTRRWHNSTLGRSGVPTPVAAAEDAGGLASCIRMVWTILISSTTGVCHITRSC